MWIQDGKLVGKLKKPTKKKKEKNECGEEMHVTGSDYTISVVYMKAPRHFVEGPVRQVGCFGVFDLRLSL